jgi:putative addiction module component (TIGR02574 family)
MSAETELLDRILLLPPGDRAALARKLILSLESPDFDADADAAWDAEIVARLAQVDRGEVAPIDWRQAIDRARQSLTRPQKA